MTRVLRLEREQGGCRIEAPQIGTALGDPILGFFLRLPEGGRRAAVPGAAGVVMSWMEERRLSFFLPEFMRMKYFCA